MMIPRFIIVMGVSGCGKSVVGQSLAAELGWQFFDGDDFHSPENVGKMSAGIPLTDADRLSWLDSLNLSILDCQQKNIHGVLACSALKEAYRETLTRGCADIALVYLKGDYDLILARMANRQGHYMKPAMLQSQFAALEEPQNAITVDVTKDVAEITREILNHFSFS